MGTAILAEELIDVGNRTAPLVIRRNPRARRLTLRIDKTGAGLALTVPPGVSLDEARRFVLRNRGWAARGLASLPAPVPFEDGVSIPLRGEDHRIWHRPDLRGGVWRDGRDLVVTGQAGHLTRRLTDWLRGEARRDLTTAARAYAERTGRQVRRVTVRDNVSRWGSCSTSGNLSFSWRLILSPPWVLDYVAAHEVAHLDDMNHSPRYWRRLRSICPRTDEAEAWLRDHGPALHRYGRGPDSREAA